MSSESLIVGVDGSAAVAGAAVVRRALEDIISSSNASVAAINSLQSSIKSIVSGATGLYNLTGLFVKLRESIIGVINFMSHIEAGVTGIASSYLSGGNYIDSVTGKVLSGADKIRAAMGDATSTVDRLRVRNYETSATLDQLVRAYQETLPVAQRVGFDRRQVEDFTVAVTQAAGAIDTTGRLMFGLGEEVRALLLGTIRNGQSRIANVLNIRPEDIKQFKDDAQGLYDFLMKKLDAYVLMGVEVQKTWGGVMSNLKDTTLNWASNAVSPLFDDFKSFAKSIISTIGSVNKDTKIFEFNPSALALANNLASIFHKTWLSIVGTVEVVINIIAAFETPLQIIGKLIGMILDGWGALLYVVLPPLAEGFNNIALIAGKIFKITISIAASIVDVIAAIGQSIGTIFSAAVKAMSGDLEGAKKDLSELFSGSIIDRFKSHIGEASKAMGAVGSAMSEGPDMWDRMGTRADEYYKKLNAKSSFDLKSLYQINPYVAGTNQKELDKAQKEQDRIDKYNLSQVTKFEEEHRKISDAFGKLRVSDAKSRSEYELAVNDSLYRSFTISEQDYANESYRIQSTLMQDEISNSQRHYDVVAAQRKRVSDLFDSAPTGTNIQIEAKNQLREKSNALLVKEIDAERSLNELKSKKQVLDINHTSKLAELSIQDRINELQADSNLLTAMGGDLAAASLRDQVSLLNIRNQSLLQLQREIALENDKARIRSLSEANAAGSAGLSGKNKFGTFSSVSDEASNLLNTQRVAFERITGEINRKIDAEMALQQIETTSFPTLLASLEREKLLREQLTIETEKNEQSINSILSKSQVAEAAEMALNDYAKSATDLASQTKSLVGNIFSGMEDMIVNFVKTGKMSFHDLADSIISDLIRIAIRASITGPLASAASSMFSGMFAAKGMAFNNGIRQFATGGIVSSPTFFNTTSGLGVMGEAGDEAIMPLTRTSSGHLGVRADGGKSDQEINVQVNVVNNTSKEVSAKSGGLKFDGKQFVITTILEDIKNNGLLRSALGA